MISVRAQGIGTQGVEADDKEIKTRGIWQLLSQSGAGVFLFATGLEQDSCHDDGK